ncbi:phospholipase D family protein [Oceanicola sp. S124]|uniref:phospholipase D family protein n=1 Tax=Oceanicola sp. S124 TaxID=1042378 RepID=UPI00025585A9|nr:phospholipase D family protein [Oceanicola sp. S124]
MPKDKDLAPQFALLVTAAEMYPALETLCLEAREEILMSFRIFDPRTRLRSTAAQDLGLETWGQLIAHVAARGVRVRLLIADFDPVFTPDLHRAAWDSGKGFAQALLKEAQARQREDFLGAEVLVARHEGRAAKIWNRIFRSRIRAAQKDLRRWSPDRLTPPQLRALQGVMRLRPATLHQKFAVADGRRAVIGGIDIDERRWDDEDHDRRAEETWHDVSTAVTGVVCRAIRRHFAECWQRAITSNSTSFAAEPDAECARGPLPAQRRSAVGPRLLRTLSEARSGPLRLGPRARITEHEEAHLAAFEIAERLVYLETQFFRHMPLARALARRARARPELNCVLILPSEPERVIFDGAKSLDARHEQALQLRCLNHLRDAFGDRLAVLAPAQPRPAPPNTPKPIHGAPVVYLHSKVTLVDDRVGIIGSANLNGRSMRWDTEASVQFQDAGQIRQARERLVASWLRGAEAGINPRRAADWTRLASEEAARAPEQRKTFLLPWPEARNRRFARWFPLLPAEMF